LHLNYYIVHHFKLFLYVHLHLSCPLFAHMFRARERLSSFTLFPLLYASSSMFMVWLWEILTCWWLCTLKNVGLYFQAVILTLLTKLSQFIFSHVLISSPCLLLICPKFCLL
jgi:hypothetical protein